MLTEDLTIILFVCYAVEDDTRVVRQCANNARDDRACYERTGTKNVKLIICECEGNLCNTAPPSIVSMNILLLTAVSALLALIFHS